MIDTVKTTYEKADLHKKNHRYIALDTPYRDNFLIPYI